MSYLVTAPLVVAADPEGALKYHYQGTEIEFLSEFDADRFLADGMVVEIGSSVEQFDEDVVPDDGPPVVPPADETRPPKTASKEAWVDFAVASGMSREEAEDASKTDLIQALG